MGDIVYFTGTFERHPRVPATAIEAEPVPAPFVVWEICPYLRSKPCGQCARSQVDPSYGETNPLCYLLAEEVVMLAGAAAKIAEKAESGNENSTP